MALETGTYISDLVSTNPTAGDAVSQGDDHLRLVKSTVKATFPNVSGAVTPTHTELNYVDGVTSAIQTQLDRATLTSGTSQASTSGTAIDFTSIPSWVKRVTIQFVGVSTNGTSLIMIQIGDAGGIEATGYLGSAAQTAATTQAAANFTTGFGVIAAGLAAQVLHGAITLTLQNSATNTWVSEGIVGFSDAAACAVSGGSKSLSATLDRVRITTVNGTDTFDAGSLNILYD